MASVPTQSESQICKPKKRTKKQQQNRVKMITGYIIYASEIRKEIIKKNPDKDFGGISKIVGAEWKNLPQETKVTYEKRAQEQNSLSRLEFANEPLNKLADVAAARAADEEMQANNGNVVPPPPSAQPQTHVASTGLSTDDNNNLKTSTNNINHTNNNNTGTNDNNSDNNNNSNNSAEDDTNDGSNCIDHNQQQSQDAFDQQQQAQHTHQNQQLHSPIPHPHLQHLHIQHPHLQHPQLQHPQLQHSQLQTINGQMDNSTSFSGGPVTPASASTYSPSPNAQPFCAASISQVTIHPAQQHQSSHHCCYICCYNGSVW